MHQYFYFIILCLSTNLNAQNVVVKGRVLITDNTPLSGVEISENDQKINTITDALGYFEFALKLDEVYNKELTFKLEGYKTLSVDPLSFTISRISSLPAFISFLSG